MLRRRSILFCEYLSLNGVIFIISLVFLKFFSIVDWVKFKINLLFIIN